MLALLRLDVPLWFPVAVRSDGIGVAHYTERSAEGSCALSQLLQVVGAPPSPTAEHRLDGKDEGTTLLVSRRVAGGGGVRCGEAKDGCRLRPSAWVSGTECGSRPAPPTPDRGLVLVGIAKSQPEPQSLPTG